MSETFKASNGVPVRRTTAGTLSFTRNGEWDLGALTGISASQEEALREFFQYERDQELGRWRWPENPNHVVYPKKASVVEPHPGFRVVHEPTGRSRDVAAIDTPEFRDNASLTRFGAAAKAYAAAHPEPKPWHEAVEGEVWLLMFPNSTQAWFVNGGYFQNVRTLTNINKTDPCITAGRRIWPEVSDA